MSSKWDQYIVSEEPTSEDKWSKYIIKDQPTEEDSLSTQALEGLKGIPRVVGQGVAGLVGAPIKAIGGGLSLLSKLGIEGSPGRSMLEKAGSYLSETGTGGQQYLSNLFESVLGKPYSEGEEFLGKTAERVGSIAGGLGLFGKLGQAEGLASLLGGGAGQTTEALGGGPISQALAEMFGMIGPQALKAIPELAKKAITSESGIQLPEVVSREGKKFGKILEPKATESKLEEVRKNISEQSENLIQNIKKKEIPISQMVEKGIDIEERNANLLNKVDKLASKIPEKYETKYISDYLQKVEENIRQSPMPSEQAQKILKKIDQYNAKFGVTEGGTHFYSPKKYIKLFRSINEDLNDIYETSLAFGKRSRLRDFNEGLKGSIVKTFEEHAPKEFSDAFKYSNEQYSQSKRLKQFEKMMSLTETNEIFDPKKFVKTISNSKKANQLKKTIGKEGFEKMKLIAKDLQKAEKNIKLVKPWKLTPLSSLIHGVAALLGFKVPLGIKITKELLEMARGYMYLSPQGSRDVSNFLKAIRSGNELAIKNSLIRLNSNAQQFEQQEND